MTAAVRAMVSHAIDVRKLEQPGSEAMVVRKQRCCPGAIARWNRPIRIG